MIGDMVYMSVLGKNIYIVSSVHVLNDLFNKRSVNYSDRPYSTMLNKLQDTFSALASGAC